MPLIQPLDTSTLLHDGYGTTGDEDRPRSAGVHLSTILTDLAVRLGVLKQWSDDPTNRFEAGFVAEGMFERAFANRMSEGRKRLNVIRQTETSKDGILMTPDAVRIEPPGEEDVLEEYKCTWMSARHQPDSAAYWRYRWQMGCYCLTVPTTRAELYLYHVNGEYARPLSPCIRGWALIYEPQELIEMWDAVLRHRDLMVKEGKL